MVEPQEGPFQRFVAVSWPSVGVFAWWNGDATGSFGQRLDCATGDFGGTMGTGKEVNMQGWVQGSDHAANEAVLAELLEYKTRTYTGVSSGTSKTRATGCQNVQGFEPEEYYYGDYVTSSNYIVSNVRHTGESTTDFWGMMQFNIRWHASDGNDIGYEQWDETGNETANYEAAFPELKTYFDGAFGPGQGPPGERIAIA